MPDGSIVVNVRNQNFYHCRCRMVVRSLDGGLSLPTEQLYFDYTLVDPAVAAGVLQKDGVLYFTNPANDHHSKSHTYSCQHMHTLRRREGGELTITHTLTLTLREENQPSHTHTLREENQPAGTLWSNKTGCNSTSTKFSLIPGVNLTLRWSTSHGRAWEARTVQIWGGPSGYSSMTSLNSSSGEDSKFIYVIYEKGRKDYYESISFVKIHLFAGQDRM